VPQFSIPEWRARDRKSITTHIKVRMDKSTTTAPRGIGEALVLSDPTVDNDREEAKASRAIDGVLDRRLEET